jgi:para-nitrobenzyl esterase
VTAIMHRCWIAFAQTGKPSCDGVPAWPAYDESSGWTMELGERPRLHQRYREKQFSAQDLAKARTLRTALDGSEVIEALRTARQIGERR